MSLGSAAFGKIACMAFELAPCVTNDDDAQLARMLARHLESRFERVSGPRKLLVPGIRWLRLRLYGGLSFHIVFQSPNVFKSRDKNRRVVMVSPLRSPPSMIGVLRGHSPTSHLTEVSSICREIHAFFSSTPGVSAIRWYFKDLRRVTKAEKTPDELPWSQA